MFTGIIRALGIVEEVRSRPPGKRLKIRGIPREWGLPAGESVAVNGACLTLVEQVEDQGTFDLGAETLRVTNLGTLAPGRKVHLEPPLKLNDLVGGDLFLGHVDGTGTVVERFRRGEEMDLVIEAPPELLPLLFPRGSLAVEGVSLTINALEGGRVFLHLIPETLRRTYLADLAPGDEVNLEADRLSRQVAWLLKTHGIAYVRHHS